MRLPWLEHSTLQLTFPLGQTALLAGIILVIITAAAEAIIRQPAITDRLAPPTTQTDHLYFDLKLFTFDQFVDHAPPDCLILGSSEVEKAIQPALMTDALSSVVGESPRCFNFSVPGLSASGINSLAGYLIEKVQPSLLIVGISPREFSASMKDSGFTGDRLDRLPWLRYQRGDLNFRGWLFSQFQTFRYYMTYRDWPVYDLRTIYSDRRHIAAAMVRGDGYWNPGGHIKFPLRPKEFEANQIRFSDFTAHPDEIAAVRDLLALAQQTGVTVVLVEMPLHPIIYRDFLGEDIHQEWQQTIRALAGSTPFWTIDEQPAIADSGWRDSRHLNNAGAKIFSQWLGERIGQAANAGTLALF